MLEARVQGRWSGLDFDVELRVEGAPLSLVGPNGAGKTTLLRMILGVVRPSSGRISLGGKVLFDSGAGIDVPPEARGIAYVPQHYALFPHLSALENAGFGLQHAHPGLSRPERETRARALLERLEIAHLADRLPKELSGGERQRVALARALAPEPRALVLDEPLAALDVGVRRSVRRFLADSLSQLKLPTLVVTHEPADAGALGGDVAVMERGRIVQRGALAELARAPATRFVEEFTAQGA
jgi:molybdate transport system ATP-binding protein